MMRILLVLHVIVFTLFSATLDAIEASINEASASFEIQKKEQNITKLLEISKTLYENNEKIKLLKASALPKLELFFEGKSSDFQTGDTVHVKTLTRHKPNEMYEKSTLEFQIFEDNLLLGSKKVELFQSNTAHEEKLSFKILKPSNNYKICAIFTEDKTHEACQTLTASGEKIEEVNEIKKETKPSKLQIAKNPDPTQTPKTPEAKQAKQPQPGDIKDETWNDAGVIYHYKVRFDGSRWLRLDGPFKAYYDFTRTSSDEWSDELAIKGKLAQEGSYKNGKFHGKITSFYGNGQVKSIEHYSEGNIIQNNMSYFWTDGKTKEVRKVIEGNIIQASWRKNGRLLKLHESTKDGYITLSEGAILSASNSKNQATCVARFQNNHIYEITCYDTNKKYLGKKTFHNNDVTVQFHPSCTNRLTHLGKINTCPNDVELQFMKQHDAFVKILTSLKSDDYMKHLIFDNLAITIGEGVYYAVYNSMLEKKLFIHNNPTQKCSYLPDTTKRQFIEFDKKIQNKYAFFLKAKDSTYDANKKMIMREFAKMYYPHQKSNNDCHNEVVNFYKQMGYL